MWAAYWVLFKYVHPWLFDVAFDRLTHSVTVERTAFVWRVLLYAVFGLLLIAVNALFDYAKIRAVVEDRHSAIGALVAAARFLRRVGVRALALYLLNGLLFLIVLAIYAAVAPGAAGGGSAMWLAFLIGQAYLLARLWVKLLFYASQTALFQSELAHAGYTAAPEPVWPDSPAAEAIANAASQRS